MYIEKKQNIVNVLIRKECFFAYLNNCSEGYLTTNRRDGDSIDNSSRFRGVVNMRKKEVAGIFVNIEDHIILCRKHGSMYQRYVELHPSEDPKTRFENAMLHIIDNETDESTNEADLP